jgi:hypothetical protein
MSTVTNRQFVSEVRSSHHLLQGDNKINDRTILREGRSIAVMLIKQQTDRRRLWSSPNLFTPVHCIQFEQVGLGECCEYTSPKMIAKSIEEIPKIGEGIYGLLVQFVSNPENGIKFIETDPMRYANILKLGLPNNKIYWWIYNRHLYISNPDTVAATLSAFFEEDVPISLRYPGEDCNCKTKPSNANLCKNPLDETFNCPGYLEDTVKKMVSQHLLQTYYNIPIDTTDNNQDETIKNTAKQG